MELSCTDLIQWRVKKYNEMRGNLNELDGYDCPLCKNRGDYLFIAPSGLETLRYCKCREIRKNRRRMEQSGLNDVMKNYSLNNFFTSKDWQKKAKEAASGFLNNPTGKWFFIGGQVGCGKTHLCTAITNKLLERGKTAKYMIWRDEIAKLIEKKTGSETGKTYSEAVKELKDVEVLYIDDFFKTEKGKTPTAAEINIAFEILNARYNRADSITIISSERQLQDIAAIDEGVGSRIFQRAEGGRPGGYCTNIPNDPKKNYRMGNAQKEANQ